MGLWVHGSMGRADTLFDAWPGSDARNADLSSTREQSASAAELCSKSSRNAFPEIPCPKPKANPRKTQPRN